MESQTATITEINKNMFFSHESFIQHQSAGKCRLVAIHGYDESTASKYGVDSNRILVSLKPLSGGDQFQQFVSDSAIFDVKKIK